MQRHRPAACYIIPWLSPRHATAGATRWVADAQNYSRGAHRRHCVCRHRPQCIFWSPAHATRGALHDATAPGNWSCFRLVPVCMDLAVGQADLAPCARVCLSDHVVMERLTCKPLHVSRRVVINRTEVGRRRTAAQLRRPGSPPARVSEHPSPSPCCIHMQSATRQ